MRVISGIYRGRVLKSPADNKTRPTSDRLRETLFNVLAPQINDETRFLDLCAGTGAIALKLFPAGPRSSRSSTGRKGPAPLSKRISTNSTFPNRTPTFSRWTQRISPDASIHKVGI